MNGIISKIARLGVSKAAAFCYAVAVGVAGNLAFNFVQQHNHPPAPIVGATETETARPDAARALSVGPTPHRAAATAAIPTATPSAETMSPIRPMPNRSTTAELPPAPVLPDPSTAALPTPDSLPAPTLRPSALPAREEILKLPASVPSTAQTLARHEPATAPAPAEAPATPAPVAVATSNASTSNAPAPLPPLGPAVDVTAPPAPPAEADLSPPPSPAPRHAAIQPSRPNSAPAGAQPLELSDLWHPGRVVRKGLHWAGDQLPAVGDKTPAFPRPAPTALPPAPISLLPAAGGPQGAEKADALISRPKPNAPGPGSGGLY